ncbi:MAG: trypsin-like peptidase domain-containing protein [Pirellulales bacterium]
MDPYPSPSAQTRPVANVSNSTSYRLPVLLLVLLVLATVAFLPTYLERVKYKQTQGELAAISEALPELKLESLGKLFTLVGRKVSPSVVHIDTERTVRWRGDEITSLLGPQIGRQQGQASGVIVDAEGYIVTNYHVVANADADSIKVNLPDGRTRLAEVIGDDAKNDLAVLKIDAEDLIPAPWGDSDRLAVGELVWALGNPFGLDNSLTFGIVSAKARRGLSAEYRYNEYLQTDAAVNPGNSGGPLVNMQGEIVGINTAIVGPTFQGISFAIPSNVARRIYQEIKETGAVANGYLGVGMEELNKSLAEQLGIEQLEGALVIAVADGSPADKAGLEPGDVVVAWNSEKIADPQQLSHNVASSTPGTKAILTLIRGGEEVKLEVTIGRRTSASEQ